MLSVPATIVTLEGMSVVYKEFAIEAIVWLIPVVILVGLAIMITRPA